METLNRTREKPTLTVLEKSRELHIILSKVTLDENFLSKVFRFTIGKPITDHSQFIYETLAVANTLDLYNKELSEDRKKMQIAALRETTKLLASLRIMHSVGNIADDKMLLLLNSVVEVERMIRKWIESDENRLGMTLSVVKKDVVKTDLFTNKITSQDLFAPQVKASFDDLLKDARNMPVPGVNHETGETIVVRPASLVHNSLHTPVVYQKVSDEERIRRIKEQGFNLGDKDSNTDDIPLPKLPNWAKPKTELVLDARIVGEPPPQVEMVPAKPIIVPDDRIVKEKKLTNAQKAAVDAKTPLAENVTIATGTPEMVTEPDDTKEVAKDEKPPVAEKVVDVVKTTQVWEKDNVPTAEAEEIAKTIV